MTGSKHVKTQGHCLLLQYEIFCLAIPTQTFSCANQQKTHKQNKIKSRNATKTRSSQKFLHQTILHGEKHPRTSVGFGSEARKLRGLVSWKMKSHSRPRLHQRPPGRGHALTARVTARVTARTRGHAESRPVCGPLESESKSSASDQDDTECVTGRMVHHVPPTRQAAFFGPSC